MADPQDLVNWLKARGEIASIKAAFVDLNGAMRGKRYPVGQAKKLAGGQMRMPLTAAFADIWGRDVIGSGEVLETGDVDGVLTPTGRGPLAIGWGGAPGALVPMWMSREDGRPFEADPRRALASVLDGFRAQNLTPVCASELEFYLCEPKLADGATADADRFRGSLSNAVYSVAELDSFEHFLDDVYAACEAMDVPADSAISENGRGQFEINLIHEPDALRAADNAVLFKYIVKSVARKHGLAATFMAKPYGDESGSGFHVHFSVLDAHGANVFAGDGPQGSPALRHAIGGLVNAMPASMLIFAPHANSYRRLRDGAHAPTRISWGYDNRTAALRVPAGPDDARRIEHRVAGADANPYLVLAAILGAALRGLTEKIEPAPATAGNVYASDCAALPSTWRAAIGAFDGSPENVQTFSDYLVRVYAACKRQEFDAFAAMVPREEHGAYLHAV